MQRSCYAYIRVSTTKQGTSGSSLQEQRFHIQGFAERQGFTVAEWFEERETAAKRGRTEFTRMLGLLRTGSIKRVVIHKIDRSARNLRDWADLAELIDAGVEVHFAHESLDLTSRGGRLSADIQAVVAADFIRNLRDEVKKGMRGRLRQGLYPLRAPIGYLDNGRGKAKTIDPVTGPIIRYAFERYATGFVNFELLRRELQQMGLRTHTGKGLSLNGLTTVFHNPFYYGLISIKKTGETFVGVHEPLIDKRLFEEVHDRLTGRKRNHGRKHSYLFQRLLKCLHCSAYLRAEIQKGRYVYYRCHTKECPSTCINESLIAAQLRFELLRVTVPVACIPDIEHVTDAIIKELLGAVGEERTALEATLLTVQGKQKRLSTLLLDERISGEDYESLRKDLGEQESSLLLRIAKVDQGRSEKADTIREVVELIKTLSYNESLDIDTETTYLATKVASNFSIDRKALVVSWLYPYSDLVNIDKVSCCEPYRGAHRTSSQRVIEVLRAYASGASRDDPRFTDSTSNHPIVRPDDGSSCRVVHGGDRVSPIRIPGRRGGQPVSDAPAPIQLRCPPRHLRAPTPPRGRVVPCSHGTARKEGQGKTGHILH